MRLVKVALLALVLSLTTVNDVQAQSPSPDGTYQTERRSSRSNRGLVKLGIAGVVLAGSGIGWAYKKIRGQ